MKIRTGQRPVALEPSIPYAVDAALLQKLFDQSPETAFLGKYADGLYLALKVLLIERHGLLHEAQLLSNLRWEGCATWRS